MGVVILSITITAKVAQLLVGALLGRATQAWRR
jgi:hypothetical protein